MNELRAIVEAFGRARERGERAALATVVSVEGSAYRRPGARMIVTESGETAGAISGGCLERDVSLRAAQVLETCAARIRSSWAPVSCLPRVTARWVVLVT